jgi:hypothetical protein
MFTVATPSTWLQLRMRPSQDPSTKRIPPTDEQVKIACLGSKKTWFKFVEKPLVRLCHVLATYHCVLRRRDTWGAPTSTLERQTRRAEFIDIPSGMPCGRLPRHRPSRW